MKRNSICFLVGVKTWKNGVFRVVNNIAHALSNENYDVIILNLFSCEIMDSSDITCNLRDISEKKNVEYICLNLSSNRKIFTMIHSLRKLLQQHFFDVIVVAGVEYCVPVWISCMGKNIKLVSWEHRNFRAGPMFKLEWFGKRLACKRYDANIVITKRDYVYYAKYKKNAKSLYQIYNLTDFNEIKDNYNIKSHKIISCGYLNPIKGFDLLIQVADGLFQDNSNWQWDIYGEGKEKENLKSMIREHHLENNVHLMGYCDDINKKYKEYSFFVLTSRTEGMGMVLLEAQKAGLPVISFDIDCGPSDVIVDGINGYLISPFDLDKMREKIKILMNSEKKRKMFSENAEVNHKDFEKRYIIDKWKNMIESVMCKNVR